MVDAPLPQPELLAAIPRLRRYARVLTGDGARADDLVQETLARGWEKRRLWQAGTDLRAWLFTIMHNVFVNQRATAVREAGNVSLDADSESGRGAWQIPVPAGQFARVELAEISGSDTFVHADTEIGEVVAQLTGVHQFKLGATIRLYLSPAQLYVFDAAGDLVAAPASAGA